MTSQPPKRIDPLLERAVEDAPRERLQWLLKNLLSESADAAKLATNLILVEVPQDKRGHKRVADESNYDGKNGVKKVKRFEICIQCYQEYDVTKNDENSCRWHPGSCPPIGMHLRQKITDHLPGECEADYDADVWADHDENCHGDPEDLRDDCPQGYKWICCEEPENAKGCETGMHVPVTD